MSLLSQQVYAEPAKKFNVTEATFTLTCASTGLFGASTFPAVITASIKDNLYVILETVLSGISISGMAPSDTITFTGFPDYARPITFKEVPCTILMQNVTNPLLNGPACGIMGIDVDGTGYFKTFQAGYSFGTTIGTPVGISPGTVIYDLTG